jgi:hypothetical protein
MRWFLLSGMLSLACSGGPYLGGSCSTTCDCTSTETPLGCVGGEWDCNGSGTCEFTCPKSCATLPYTCPSEAGDCNPNTHTCTGHLHCP